MPTNYEVLRNYAEAKTHFLDQRTEAGLPNGNEEQFFNFLHEEYVPPKPKPLTIPQRRAVDIAHAIFTQCVVQEDWNRTLTISAIKTLPGWRNYCEAQWLDPDCYSTIWQAIQLLRDAGLVNIIGSTKNRMYQFVNTEDDEAYRLLAETVRKDRNDTESKENVA